jgi:hypothetical protein
LIVTDKAWASQEAGTPLDTQGVPDGDLPVGTRLGQVDKASYVRLSGSESTLKLREDAAGNRAPANGEPLIRACQITDASWKPATAEGFGSAPKYDTGACVDGKRAADGTWSFDLSNFDDATDARGFALVPAAGAPVDFQVAFH